MNVPVTLQGPSVFTLSDELKDVSDAASQTQTSQTQITIPQERLLIQWIYCSELSSLLVLWLLQLS